MRVRPKAVKRELRRIVRPRKNCPQPGSFLICAESLTGLHSRSKLIEFFLKLNVLGIGLLNVQFFLEQPGAFSRSLKTA